MRIERRSTYVDILQQIARFNVAVDDRSGKEECAARALGRMRIHEVLDKCVKLVDWVGIVVVAFAVADLGSRNLKGISTFSNCREVPLLLFSLY